MTTAQLDAAAEEYLRNKRVHYLFNDLAMELVAKKPDEPLGFLAMKLKEMQGKTPQTKQPRGPTKYPKSLDERALTIVVFGASGDLARKKTYPALFQLYGQGLLPKTVSIVGYARSDMTDTEFHKRITPSLSKGWEDGVLEAFLTQCSFVQGSYNEEAAYEHLDRACKQLEEKRGGPEANRLFYLALPPSVFLDACKGITSKCMAHSGWSRVVIEKPFGHDTESSAVLSRNIGALLKEDQIYRIDHYLGKEMVQNLLTMRFANKVFTSLWDKNSIANVQITFKEKIGTQGRGGYFDKSGIIRDVLQNHLLQILSLVAMEKPKSLDPEHIRDEKVSVLKSIAPVTLEDTILGQYTKSEDGKEPGYLDDETVPKGSNCPTFAQTILWVHNDRWDGVPFILKAAKAVEAKEVTVRLQFKPEIRPFVDATSRNELVIRMQPNEAMYLKVNAKEPGMSSTLHTTELDLTYQNRYNVYLPDAYESLIYEAVVGHPTNFVRSDELDAAWRIFTPLLHRIEGKTGDPVKPTPYTFGTRGPPQADQQKEKYYKKTGDYNWPSSAL